MVVNSYGLIRSLENEIVKNKIQKCMNGIKENVKSKVTLLTVQYYLCKFS